LCGLDVTGMSQQVTDPRVILFFDFGECTGVAIIGEYYIPVFYVKHVIIA
jgi:hypothetical protein